MNVTCEDKFVQLVIKSHLELGSQDSDTVAFESIKNYLSEQLLKDNIGSVYKDELRAFLRVRSRRLVRRRVCYVDIPGTKPELIKRCCELKDTPYSARLYPDCPDLPILLGNNVD